jgi:hypothetical protein
MGEHKAAVRLVGLRHAKKGSIIAEALEIIDLHPISISKVQFVVSGLHVIPSFFLN